MARRKGAKDKTPRKKATGTVRKPTTQPAAGQSTGTKAQLNDNRPPGGSSTAAIPPSEFEAAIAAELADVSSFSTPLGPTPTVTATPASVPVFNPATLTLEGLTAAWQLPFYALGVALLWLRVTPDAEAVYAVGRRRAKDLARPSYAIYEHYTREYLQLNPDSAVHVAAGATALNLVGLLPEIIDAVLAARRKAAKAASNTDAPARGTGPETQPPAGGTDAAVRQG